jgi:hypothetical protein
VCTNFGLKGGELPACDGYYLRIIPSTNIVTEIKPEARKLNFNADAGQMAYV